MDKNSKSNQFDIIKQSYLKAGGSKDILDLLVPKWKEAFHTPFKFDHYHKKIRSPFDFYKLGLDFIRPLVDFSQSKIYFENHLHKIEEILERKENVILLANHQTEADPQVISLLLEKHYPLIADKIIFVAGERVVLDPLAIPFSMGCNLLCIYSKRYLDTPPDLKEAKMLHNKKTMQKMSELLSEGGKIIYIAASGGRDRKNQNDQITLASFEPSSIELIYLTAQKAKSKTHFFPFALYTYNLAPPPATIQKALGEERIFNKTFVHIAFGEEFNMEIFPGSDENDKKTRRINRAVAIWNVVKNMYDQMEPK